MPGGQVEPASVDAGLDELIDASVPDASGLPDAPEVPPDATNVTAYEVAYGNVFTFLIADLVVNDWLIVINTGDIPLDMGTIEIISVSDDHPTATIRVSATPHSAIVTPGFAGGHLGIGYEDAVINSGLVTEPRVDFGNGASSVLRMWLDPVGTLAAHMMFAPMSPWRSMALRRSCRY